MVFHTIVRFLHIIFFASWFGTILASLFFLKAIENKLTGCDGNTAEFAALLQRFVKLETKVADVAVIGVILSGILLAVFYHGWTLWVGAKIVLMVLQIGLTIGYILRSPLHSEYCSSLQQQPDQLKRQSAHAVPKRCSQSRPKPSGRRKFLRHTPHRQPEELSIQAFHCRQLPKAPYR